MANRRKRCLVYIETKNEYNDPMRRRCENKIKPGTPFCKEHFETHKLVKMKCNGEAHSNPFIDHCGICMPHWGSYPVAAPKDQPGEPWTKEGWE